MYVGRDKRYADYDALRKGLERKEIAEKFLVSIQSISAIKTGYSHKEQDRGNYIQTVRGG